jgi:hypothetical protein
MLRRPGWGVLLVVSLLMAHRPAQARPAAPAASRAKGAVRSLERNLSRLSRIGSAMGHDFMALAGNWRSGWATINLRPDRRVIVVSSALQRKGFFLEQTGRLSSMDRQKLTDLIATSMPHATATTVNRTLLGSLSTYNAHRRVLRGQDGRISQILQRAAAAEGGARPVVWRDNRGNSLTFRRGFQGGYMLVSPRRAFDLQKTKAGLEVAPHARMELQQYLHDRSTR